MNPADLPIWQIDSQIVKTLRSANRLVLVAPTGSGKTTQVPQMLLDAGLAGDKKIVVLQPRRVAARTVAARVAWERQCQLGAEVGYQIRFDDQTSLGTRISYVTEGILLRWLQDDRSLSEVAVVLFDEFHERNLLSDVALALVKHLQQNERPDLKIAVMSATLDAEPVAEYLSDKDRASKENVQALRSTLGAAPCPILISEGQSFPVEVRYSTHHDERPVTEQAADIVERIVKRMTALNNAIRKDDKNLGRGYEVGHSYFCVTADIPNINDWEAWYRSIIELEIGPLLREYWFDDAKRASDHIEKLLE